MNTLLAFSRGKDSLACWITFEQQGIDFVPYTLMDTPGGLPSQHRYCDYLESVTGRKIHRYTHPGSWSQIRNGVLSVPGQERPSWVPKYSIHGIECELANELGWSEWQVAIGLRSADSVNRKLSIRAHETRKTPNPRNLMYPVASLKYDDIEKLLTESGYKLPSEYRMLSRSADDLFSLWLAGDAEDREKLEEWFPALPIVQKRFHL